MSDIIETILVWLLIIVGIVIACGVTYCILYWLAHQAATKAMEEREKKLAEESKKFEEKELRFKAYGDEKYAELMSLKKEVTIKEEQAKEILSNVEKIREETKIKIDKLTRENTQLRNDLVGARQRANRLAKREL
jgi:F0F1-type ATP synthase membrane subunit b/b'